MIILDAKSIKNTYLAALKGYDGGKKISGIKLHIGVDTLGLPHATFITTANVTDRDGAIEMLEIHASELPKVLKALCDGGYTGEKFACAVKMILGAEVEIAKRSELHKFAIIPKRWVVERTFGWLENCRRLWKNCERHIDTSLQMNTFAFIALILNRW
jgi:transposase